MKSMSTGKSSSRPTSISKVSTSLLKALKAAKFLAGPTPASPGPMLLIVAATAVKLVYQAIELARKVDKTLINLQASIAEVLQVTQ